MGFFEKLFKKKTAPVVSSPDKAVTESKPDINITITTRPAYEERKPIGELSAVDNVEYRFECQNETYYVIYKNEKEFFDGDKAAECGDYILAEGWSGNSQAIAFFTLNKLIAIRKTDDSIEAVKIFPSGIAFVFTDEDKLLIMSETGTTSKSFTYSSAPDNMRALNDIVCAYVEDSGEYGVLKCFNFTLQSVWSKKISYNLSDDAVLYSDEPTLQLSDDMLKVVAPGGVVSQFSFSGEKIKG